jgi:hypothetical protein
MLTGMTFTAGKYLSAVHAKKTVQPGDIQLNHQFWLIKEINANRSKALIIEISSSQFSQFSEQCQKSFQSLCLFIPTA